MKLKIGLFNDSFPPTIDGVANTVLNYANIITEKHGTVVVATPKYPHVKDHYPFEVYRYPSVPLLGGLTYRAGNPFLPSTIAELRMKKMDLVHVHSPFASSILARQVSRIAWKRQIPVVLTYHTKFEYDIAKWLPTKKMQKPAIDFVRMNVSSADEVWAVSKGAGESLRTIGYKGEFRVMENGTDFVRGRAKDAILQRIVRMHGIQPEETIFLFVGRMMWYKNLKLILDTLRILKEAGICFRALFVGEGNDRAAVEHYAEEIRIKDKTVFTGAVYDRELLRGYYSLADLFLFPSTYDTSGLVVKEAAACGCASLLVAGSCAAEGITDGRNGILAQENATDCAARILQILQTSEGVQHMGQLASQEIYLSWEDSVKKAYRRYEEICAAWPRKLPYLSNKYER